MMISFSRSKVRNFIFVFLTAQLAMWYGGLRDLIPAQLTNVWNLLQLASVCMLVFLFIVKRKTPSLFTILFLISRMVLVFSTWVNGNPVDFLTVLRTTGLILLIDLYSDRLEETISPIMLIFEIMVYYNLITVLLNGPDIYGAFYGALGYDNDFTRYLIVAYLWAMIYRNVKARPFRPIMLIAAIHATVLITWCGTGVLALLVIDALLIADRITPIRLDVMKGYMIYLVTEVLIVFLRLQNLFKYLIVDVLHKDLTLTGRTLLWDKALELIAQKPLLGWGNMDQVLESRLLGGAHCHNALLEQMFRGGLLYCGLFFAMILAIHKRTKALAKQNKLVVKASFALLTIWMVCVTESILEDYVVFMALALINSMSQLVERKKD